MKRAKDKRVGTLLLGRMLSVLLSAHLAVGMLPVEAIAEVRVEALGEEVAASDSEMQDDESLDSIARGRSLNDFAVGAEVLGGEQRPDAIAVEEGAAYDVVVSFAENEGLQFAEDGELAYALPEGFEPTEDQPGFTGKLAVSNGVTDEAGFELAVENMRVEDGAVRFGWNTGDENYASFVSANAAEFELTIRGAIAAGITSVAFAQEPTAVEVITQESPEDAPSTEEAPVEDTTEQALPETDAPEEGVTEEVPAEQPETPEEQPETPEEQPETPEEQTETSEERSDETDNVQSDALSDKTTNETQKDDDAESPQATESEVGADENAQEEAAESRAASPASKASEMTIAMGDTTAEISYGGEVQWYRFVPPTSGTYVFESFGSSDTYGSLYDSSCTQLVSDDDSGDGLNFMVSRYLTSGTTYYLTAKYLSTLNTGSIRLSLSMSASLGTTYARVASAGTAARLRFVPPTSGTYAFGSTGSDDTCGTIYDYAGARLDYDDDDGENRNFMLSRYLYSGSPCFLDACYYSSSATGTIEVRIASGSTISSPSITSQPSSITVNEGSAATFSVAATGDGISYRWQFQARDSSIWQNASADGCTTATLSFQTTVGMNGRKFRCVVTDQNGNSVTSSEATLTVRAGEMTIAMGDAIAEISSAGDEQWYRFVPPTSGTYVFESFGSDDTYGCIYDAARTLLISDDDGGDGWNFMVSGYLTGGTTYYFAAKYLSTLNTGSIRLSLSMSASLGTTYARVASAGEVARLRFVPPTSGDYAFGSVSTDDTYGTLYDRTGTYLEHDDDSGEYNNFEISRYLDAESPCFLDVHYYSPYDTGTIAVRIANGTSVSGPAITSQPSSVTVDEDATATFSVDATGDGLSYQWQYQASDSSSWSNTSATGCTTNTMRVKATTGLNGRKFRCVVTDQNGNSVTSSAATLTVRAKPKITRQPTNVTANEDATATFSVAATGDGISYQWQYQARGASTWQNTSATGCKTATLKVKATAGLNGRKFRCVVTDRNGKRATSSAATLTVRAKLKITRQPSSVTANECVTATFSVATRGDGISYQWQYQARGASTWNNTSATGCKTATLKVKATAGLNGRKFRCVVTDRYGKRVTSSAATLTVRMGPAITRQPSSATVNECATATFSVAATGDGISYQWQYQVRGTSAWKNTSANGCKTATLKFKAKASLTGRKFRCVVTDRNGKRVTSSAATLTVRMGPAITRQPASVTANEDATATFSVAATGNGISYQWQYQASDSSSWSNTSATGCKTATLKVKATAGLTGRKFRCVVKDRNGKRVTSSAATLTVRAKPKITRQPASVTANEDATATFSVAATGSGLSYQWQYQARGASTWNNTSATGCKTATIRVKATSGLTGRKFRCVVKDQYGRSVTSSAATLTVRANPVTYRALLIGNSDYPYVNSLSGPGNDTCAMAGMLRGLSNSYMTDSRSNRTASQMQSDIASAFANADSNDVSLFYYSGHGCGFEGGVSQLGALCGVNYGQTDDVLTTSQLASALSQVPGKVIVILDSCFSGAAITNVRSKSAVSPSVINQHIVDTFESYDTVLPNSSLTRAGELCTNKFVVITSSTAYETSAESVGVGGYVVGHFTAALLDATGCSYPNGSYGGAMAGDADFNSRITLGEAERYVRSVLNEQTCQAHGSEGEILFRRG